MLAIGNPFGLERTLTRGIVSGIGRPVSQTERDENGISSTVVIQNMIQTDASINPGNSGGPLLNSRGELIGVNTMIYSPSGGSVGIGFAVPVATAKRVVPELMKYGRVARGWIDVDHRGPLLRPRRLHEAERHRRARRVRPPRLPGQAGGKRRQGRHTRRHDPGAHARPRPSSSAATSSCRSTESRPTPMADLYVALENTKPGDRVDVVYYRGNKKLSTQIQLSDRAKAGIGN